MKKINKYDLKKQLNDLLKAGRKITFDFNCGNDEAHITPFIDGKILEYGSLYFDLEELIFVELNLPSVGEYMVTGTGNLTIEDDNIFLYYDLEGFTHDWGDEEDYDDDEEDEDINDEPKKNIVEKMQDSYLLLSSEYDAPSPLGESSQEKEALDEEQWEKKEIDEQDESTVANFSKEEQKIWENLKGEKLKPWWKFW